MKSFAAILFLIVAPLSALQAAKPAVFGDEIQSNKKLPETQQEEKARAERLRWFREAKYGLFIHWGLFVFADQAKGETSFMMWNEHMPVKKYDAFAKQFNPVKFDADAWAQLAVDAGMKYIVFTAKHCDGFAVFGSKADPFNIVDATPWHRDPLKELQAACQKRDIKLCVYYAQAVDWHEPGGSQLRHEQHWDPTMRKSSFESYLNKKSLPQLRELLTNYGPLGLIWFDTPVGMTRNLTRGMGEMVRELQPNVLINSRIGPGGDYDYFSCKDNQIPATPRAGAWETAATLGCSWAYRTSDTDLKPPAEVCFKLVDIASKGGNFLLDVGPTREGVITQPSQDILLKVGAWLKVNGEAIYGAGPTPFGQEFGQPVPGKDDYGRSVMVSSLRDWRCTTQPGKLHIHLFKWPGAKFDLTGLKNKVTKAYLLADQARKPLPVTQTNGKLEVSLPPKAPDALASVLCLENQ